MTEPPSDPDRAPPSASAPMPGPIGPQGRGGAGRSGQGRAGPGAARGRVLWALGALVITVLVTAPVISVLVMAFQPRGNVWPHLLATALPRYLGNTVVVMAGAGAFAAIAGTGAAWLVVMYRFPGRRVLAWLLFLPLAVPGYVGAYALVDFLDYSGAMQTALRRAMGWSSARDYWFPEIRSRWAAGLVLGASLYPYVYLMARAAFAEQSGASFEVARALGSGPWGRFWRVGLPLARPGIAAGVAVVMMETVADFGVTDYFGVQTMTTGVFSVWLSGGDRGAAAQIAVALLGLVLMLVAIERAARRRGLLVQGPRAMRPVAADRLTGWRGALAAAFCAAPFILGFVFPVAVMTGHALANPDAWFDPGLLRAALHTLVTGGAAALVTVGAAFFLAYAVRLARSPLPGRLMPLATLGYAAPGAVLAVGLLFPLAAVDRWLAGVRSALFGTPPALILTGTAVVLIYAYAVRFFAIAQGAVDAAFGRVPPTLGMAARSLGRGPGGTLARVYLPMMRGSAATALLLVFVDCVKELPATLLLRPFNYETLATRVHEKASLENLGDASPAALLVILTGLLAALLLARANRQGA